jgi:hypothetical protein
MRKDRFKSYVGFKLGGRVGRIQAQVGQVGFKLRWDRWD